MWVGCVFGTGGGCVSDSVCRWGSGETCEGVRGRARACRGVLGRAGLSLGGAGRLVRVGRPVSVVVVGGEQGFGAAPVVGESYGGAPGGACDACWGVPELPAQFFG